MGSHLNPWFFAGYTGQYIWHQRVKLSFSRNFHPHGTQDSEITISEYLAAAVLCNCDIMVGFFVETIPTDGNF